MTRKHSGWSRALGSVLRAAARLLRDPAARSAPGRIGAPVRPGPRTGAELRDLTDAEARQLRISYAPNLDGAPDPGEIVWAWVPFEEHDGRGKDRPILIIARIDAHTTAGCPLSSKQHHGAVSIGSGPWDRQLRESFVSPRRILAVPDAAMRREGHVLDRETFMAAAAAVTRRLSR